MASVAAETAPFDKDILETGNTESQKANGLEDVEAGPEEVIDIDRIEAVYRCVSEPYVLPIKASTERIQQTRSKDPSRYFGSMPLI